MEILIFILILVGVICCFVFPRRYSDMYLEKYGSEISYPVSIILAIAICWFLIELDMQGEMYTVSLVVLIIACIIMFIKLMREYIRKDVSIKDKALFTLNHILFTAGSFVLIVFLLAIVLGLSDSGKRKRR